MTVLQNSTPSTLVLLTCSGFQASDEGSKYAGATLAYFKT
jgi:hypothetical protein